MPTLVSEDAIQRCVRIANLSEEDYILPSHTPVAVLHTIDGVESDEGLTAPSLQISFKKSRSTSKDC